jgi:hypothetical protein
MQRQWFWEETGAGEEYGLRLGVTDAQSGETVYLTRACGRRETLRQSVATLTAEIEEMLRRGEETLEARSEPDGDTQPEPEEVWQYMEALPTEEEMFRYFNSLQEETRRVAAEYILTQVSMFKGRGASFALHYDADTHRLR